eukprot:gene5659-11420_t
MQILLQGLVLICFSLAYSFHPYRHFGQGRGNSCNTRSKVLLTRNSLPYIDIGNIEGSELNSKLKSAIKLMQNEITKDSNNYDAMYKMGLLLLQVQSTRSYEGEAYSYFSKSVELHYESEGAWYNMAAILENQQDYNNAITAYRNTIQYSTNKDVKSACYNNIIRILMDLNQIDDAANVCNEAVNSNPEDANAWTSMGIILLQNKALDWAEVCFKNAISTSSGNNLVALNNLGFIYKDKGDVAIAEAYFRAALDIDPLDEASSYALGMLLLDIGNKIAATSAFKTCLEANPNNEQAAFQLQLLEDVNGMTAPAAAGAGSATATSTLSDRSTLSPEYVKQLFDFYASNGYDEHMIQGLSYKGPEILWEAFAKTVMGRRLTAEDKNNSNNEDNNNDRSDLSNVKEDSWYVLDIGCGTGLVGKKFRALLPGVKAMMGCDLSPQMVDMARSLSYIHRQRPLNTSPYETLGDVSVNGDYNDNGDGVSPVEEGETINDSVMRPVYDALVADDCVDFISANVATELASSVVVRRRNVYPWNLVLAGDVLGYLGDLEPLFSKLGELFGDDRRGSDEETSTAMTTKTDFKLSEGGRFVHRREYVQRMAQQSGLDILSCDAVTLRMQNQQPVAGLVFVLTTQAN